MDKTIRTSMFWTHPDFDVISALISAMPRTCQLTFTEPKDMFGWVRWVAHRNRMEPTDVARVLTGMLSDGHLTTRWVFEDGPVMVGFEDTFQGTENTSPRDDALQFFSALGRNS